MDFLIVGHTYKDIDAYFICLSRRLWHNNTYMMANLMQSLMESKDLIFIPMFVQEVGDFKDCVKGFLHESTNTLVGLHLFKFYVLDNRWPMMKYKKISINQKWLQPGRVVKM